MGLWEIFLIGAALSADAFAASLCKGLEMKKISPKKTAVIALFFGGFQALMPCIGYILGEGFERYITKIDHWIAFGLLTFIGARMIFDAIFRRGESEERTSAKNIPFIREIFFLAVATSIDALAVGVSFAFLDISILSAAAVIGLTTFFISIGGVLLGRRFGGLFKSKAEILGGVILVIIGIKILIGDLLS